MKNNFTLLPILTLLLVCGVFSFDADEVKSVMEGDSVTLHTGLTDIQGGDVIRWRFGEEGSLNILVDIVKNSITYNSPFKDRLQIDSQTGDLTITNMRIKHSGLYEAQISSVGTTYKRFRVTVTESPHVLDADTCDVKSVSVMEGQSVTLPTNVQTHRDDLIVWRFGPTCVLIAKDDKEDNKISIYDDDGRFRHRLKLNDRTGSLTITSIRITDSGLYHLKISRNNNQTLCKTFSVSLRGQTDITTTSKGLYSGDVVGIVFGVLLAAVVGVFSYRRVNYERQKRKVKEKTVFEGDSVTLHTGVTELKSGDVIQWMLRDELIHTFNKNNMISVDEERLGDRLQVDVQTGSLIIRNMRKVDAGLYKVKMSSSSKVKSFLQFIISRGPTFSQFNVIVTVTVWKVENESLILHTGVTDLQSDDEIQWMFGETLIAEINRKNNTISTHDDVLDGIFRDKLKLDDQTGSLTITDLDIEHTGEYKLRTCVSSTVDDLQVKVFVRERMESAKLGGSVTLNTDDTEIQTDDEIQWRFGDEETLIAQMTVGSELSYDSTDERFRNRLILNPQTGDLTITDITAKLSGVYKAKIINSRRRETEYRKYKVVISVFAYKRESVTLHTDSEIQRGSEIEWISCDNTRLVTGKNGDESETKYTEDERFRDRLEMNHQTGDLTITDIRETDMGLYTQIISDGKISYRIFQVWIWGDPFQILNKQKSGETREEETVVHLLSEAEAAV